MKSNGKGAVAEGKIRNSLFVDGQFKRFLTGGNVKVNTEPCLFLPYVASMV